MCGLKFGFGFLPCTSVGAKKNWRQEMKDEGAHCVLLNDLQAIHFASGATPILLFPTPPQTVPVQCVPWLFSSQP